MIIMVDSIDIEVMSVKTGKKFILNFEKLSGKT